MFYVYELINPITKDIFYVGKGRGNRMYTHVQKVKRNIRPNGNIKIFTTIN